MGKHKGWKWFLFGLLFVLGIGFIGIAIFLWAILDEEELRLPGFGKSVALVEIEGVISDSRVVVRQLKKYGEDKNVSAIVCRIDSPGGEVASSQEIYEEMKKVRENGKKIICSMGGVAASGGYYIACAADTIIANSGTLTGSIGVMMGFPNTEELLKKIGVRFQVVKSSEHKDIGSWYRQMTEEEEKLLKGVIDDVYEQFVEIIVKERGIEREKVLEIADGRIFSGRQALKLKLVDRLGTLEDAISLAGKISGIKGKPRVIKERKRRMNLWDLIDKMNESVEEMNRAFLKNKSFPRLEYRFR